MMKNIIIEIEKGSIAEAHGINSGHSLLSINGNAIKDVFDYRYFLQDKQLQVVTVSPNGNENIYLITKDEQDDIGLVFQSGLMDEAKSCRNKCIFCFIDQMPPNMRETLYFKDDDGRLSFLSGNYVTLTNMTEDDVDRIIFCLI